LIILIGTSCEFFNLKKKSQVQEVGSIIDFSTVDSSPTFKACIHFIDKEEKSNCFRKKMYTHISKSLAKYKFEIRKPFEEIIQVVVLIDPKGNITVKKILSSDLLQASISSLDSIITASILSLPKLFPATKRGIKVTTQYQIPIQIRVH
jgi:NAD-specific glutamate dehydrogenase